MSESVRVTPLPTASWGRRILALAVDWVACILVVMIVLGPAGWLEDPRAGFYTLLVLVAESAVGTALAGGSFGKLATRLRVVRTEDPSQPVDLLRALLRSALVALVVPPLLAKPDGRGLHDMAAGTMTVRLADLQSR